VSDIFDERYDEGILEELPVDEPEGAAEAGLEAAPGAAFALRGCVLTPEKKLDDGYVVIAGSTIASVGTSKPEGVKIIDTEGVIMPGLIDLHGHPEYNVFAAWEPPKEYVNRHAWRGSKEYGLVVKEPWKKLTAAPGSLLRELTRYAEVRALVGGVTAIQGASAKYPGKDEALVRNVDLPIFGRHRARSVVDLDRVDEARRKSLRKEIDDGRTTAVYIHLAEGKADNKRSQDEFGDLVDANLLTEATVIIHGTALTDASLGDLKDAGGKLVWSPQSNLRLYGQTTPAAKLLDLEIPMGLGADWLPSGSQSLLAELSVARRTLARQGKEGAAVDKKLVRMVTSEAAEVAGLGEELGQLEAGGGDVAYGRADWVGEVVASEPYEPLLGWGKQMLLDTSFKGAGAGAPGVNPGNLAEIRKKLLGRFPQTGPIFA
jgi:hypothetical protein